LAPWFGAGLIVPLRAGLVVFAMLPLLALAISLPRYILPALAVLIFFLGVHVSSEIELATGIKDDRRIVIDEVALSSWELPSFDRWDGEYSCRSQRSSCFSIA
jgi:phosphatidylglycerophosphatase A